MGGERKGKGGVGWWVESTNKAEKGKRKCTAVLSWFLSMTGFPLIRKQKNKGEG